MNKPDWRKLDPPHSNYCSNKMERLLDEWFEKNVAHRFQFIRCDLTQTKINAKAIETKLRNQIGKLTDKLKTQR